MIANVDEIKRLMGIDTDTETDNDFIQENIPTVQDFIFDFIGHRFMNNDVYISSGSAVFDRSNATIKMTDETPLTEGFYNGCDIIVQNSLSNDSFLSVKSIATDTFTVDDMETLNDETSSETVYIFRSDVPKAIKMAMAKIIKHDMRDAGLIDKSVESERVGDTQFNYTKQSERSESGYPADIMSILKRYQRAKFVASF